MRKIKIAPFMPTEVEVNEISANRAEIVAYPFESGYAVTLAHPLRRLILGSSIGYAPISVKIDYRRKIYPHGWRYNDKTAQSIYSLHY